jgi:small GTP-binding protein
MGQYEMKIVVLGSGGVGKSSMTIRFVQAEFFEEYNPTVEDMYRKRIELFGHPITLEILDTAGIEQFTSMRGMQLRDGHGFLIVYSVCSVASFRDAEEMYQEIARTKETTNFPGVLAGNKCDMERERQVSTKEGKEMADKHQLKFFETSAKTNVNIEACFTELAKIHYKELAGSSQKKKKCTIL